MDKVFCENIIESLKSASNRGNKKEFFEILDSLDTVHYKAWDYIIDESMKINRKWHDEWIVS